MRTRLCDLQPRTRKVGLRPAKSNRPRGSSRRGPPPASPAPVAARAGGLYRRGSPRDPAMPLVYKIAPRPLWRAAEEAGRFTGAPVDLADGFIHFSTAEQVAETAARHFSGVAGLGARGGGGGPSRERAALRAFPRRRPVPASLRRASALGRRVGSKRCRSMPTGATSSRLGSPTDDRGCLPAGAPACCTASMPSAPTT